MAHDERPANRLAGEKSPYLLQHAHNPVDWHPWGEEAFQKARQENKPIFLSIGYSTCHWCHVMERESFENAAIAAQMNRDFVSIKVDREERPDIDRVYMAYVQASTGSGGWPMSVWLTPDLKPFHGGTYFPPDDRYGRPGFPTVLERIAEVWREKREEVERAGNNITAQLYAANAPGRPQMLDTSAPYHLFKIFEESYDKQNGGFGGAPKFPRASNFNFLFRYFAHTGDQEAARMVFSTLFAMSYGGIYDHLGGGFHRYSVDEYWHVPHFEKMLYDQAQLAAVYLDAYQLTREEIFARVARETLDYVLRDLTDAATGAFYSAEDADSLPPGGAEKSEGAFYVWTAEELDEALGPAAELFKYHYSVLPEGNADDPHGELAGKNILHVVHTVEETAGKFEKTPEQVQAALGEGREKLSALRNTRPRPHLDDKVITAWNGLMLTALSRAAQVLADPAYLAAAERAAQFIRGTLWDEQAGTLVRRYRDGEAAFEGNAEDYALLVQGLLDLYEASFNLDWLLWAERLTARMLELFWDEGGGALFATSGRDPSVLMRLKDDYDGAEPSANSVAALNLVRLAETLDRPAWLQAADQTVQAFSQRLNEAPQALPQLLVAALALRDRPAQVVIAGERAEPSTAEMIAMVHSAYIPNKVLLLADAAAHQQLDSRLPHLAGMTSRNGRAVAFVCRQFACERPAEDADVLREMLARSASRPVG